MREHHTTVSTREMHHWATKAKLPFFHVENKQKLIPLGPRVWKIEDGSIKGEYEVSGLGENDPRRTDQHEGLLRLNETSGKGTIIAKKLRVTNRPYQDLQPLFDEGIALGEMEKIGGSVPHVIGYAVTPEGEPMMLLGDVSGRNIEDLSIETINQTRKTLPLSLIARVMEPVMYTLELAHAHGLVYRDLKPSNIQVADDGRVVLLDWETRDAMGAPRSQENTKEAFTEGYAAPEYRMISNQIDQRFDVYSTAATITTLVSGYTLDKNHTAESAIIKHILPRYPRLANTLIKAVQQRPDQRYYSIAEFRDELRTTELYSNITTLFFTKEDLIAEIPSEIKGLYPQPIRRGTPPVDIFSE